MKWSADNDRGMIEYKQKELDKRKELLQRVVAVVGEESEFDVCTWSDTPHVIIKDIHELTEVRSFMRQVFGDWKDEFDSTWNPYDEVVMAQWRDKRHLMVIRLETTIDGFPKELMPSEGCKWERQMGTRSLVCPTR